jgi:hypothetical protein
MRYVVFPTRVAALNGQATAFTRLTTELVARGHSLDAVLGLRGKLGNDVTDAPLSAQRTTAWADPAQRLDGKWVIPHPEEHPLCQRFAAVKARVVTAIDNAIAGTQVAIEEFSAAWFPVQTLP